MELRQLISVTMVFSLGIVLAAGQTGNNNVDINAFKLENFKSAKNLEMSLGENLNFSIYTLQEGESLTFKKTVVPDSLRDVSKAVETYSNGMENFVKVNNVDRRHYGIYRIYYTLKTTNTTNLLWYDFTIKVNFNKNGNCEGNNNFCITNNCEHVKEKEKEITRCSDKYSKPGTYDADCKDDIQCQYSIWQGKCVNKTTVSQCNCPEGTARQILDGNIDYSYCILKDRNSAAKKPGPDATCTYSEECGTRAQCIEKKCRCPSGRQLIFDSFCGELPKCKNSCDGIFNRYCKDNKCICRKSEDEFTRICNFSPLAKSSIITVVLAYLFYYVLS